MKKRDWIDFYNRHPSISYVLVALSAVLASAYFIGGAWLLYALVTL